MPSRSPRRSWRLRRPPAELLPALRERGYEPDGPVVVTGGAGRAVVPLTTRSGARVFAKVYGDLTAEASYLNMRAAWDSSFGERRDPPGLPRPVDCLPDAGILVMECLDGTRLSELGGADRLNDAVRLLAALHGSDAEPAKRRDAPRVVRSVRRKGDQVEHVHPNLGAHFHEVADALEGSMPADRELCPAHGDFSPENVLMADDRMVLVDWDRFQAADPARDLAHLGSWHWVRALERGERPDWSVLERAVRVYEAARPDSSVEEHIGFHLAAALMRRAHVLALAGGRAELVPLVAEEALTRAGSA